MCYSIIFAVEYDFFQYEGLNKVIIRFAKEEYPLKMNTSKKVQILIFRWNYFFFQMCMRVYQIGNLKYSELLQAEIQQNNQ